MNEVKVAKRTLIPMYDRLIVRRIEAIKETEGGVFIPDEAQEKPNEGEVLAVGPGHFDRTTKEFLPLQVKKGDFILFGRYAGIEVAFDDDQNTQIVILREDEILAIERKADLGIRKLKTKRSKA